MKKNCIFVINVDFLRLQRQLMKIHPIYLFLKLIIKTFYLSKTRYRM